CARGDSYTMDSENYGLDSW
nr:immunoglobulin heavy chain junction region [Macaca mulatta]MOX95785.1 immunoglobulin heavy chain junction region [Macaca mulatta]MOX95954.1 immunoglobulin heavy chain junction region [Macaca mulatta]MOX97015.1 immunoglobulin heavy chain junction region [Macaca mulatta]MOX97104.1 immunoglobulin heavy chain junction region [Macaca mulatta]